MRMSAAIQVIAVAVALASAATCARGAETIVPWVGGHGSWGTYAMGDVNHEISQINEQLGEASPHLDKIRGGFGFGFEAGVEVRRVSFGLGYERLLGSTDLEVASGTIRYAVPANAVMALAQYRFAAAGPLRARIGGAWGVLALDGRRDLTALGPEGGSVRITGTSPLLEADVAVELWASPLVALGSSCGYRYARVGRPLVERLAAFDESVDYSGFVVHAGLKFILAP